MSDFNAAEAERLAAEFAEDVIGNRATCMCENCTTARTRLKNNARSAAEQLRAAVAEVGRFRAVSEDPGENVDMSYDHARRRLRVLIADLTACRQQTINASAERDALRTRLAEVEKLCEEACDIANQHVYGGRGNHPLVIRIAAIRAELAKKETL